MQTGKERNPGENGDDLIEVSSTNIAGISH
jgi:hypothetical protein